MAGLIAYGTAGIVSAGRTPRGTWQEAQPPGPPRRARPGQPLCARDLRSLRWVVRKDSLMNGGYPYARRIGEDAPPWRLAPPAGANGRGLPPAHGSRPASVRRSAACDSGRGVCGRWRRLPPKGAGPALTDSIHYRGCCRGAGCLRPGRRGSSARRRQALTGALRNPATVATAVRGCATVISAVHGFTGPGKPSPEWIDRDASRAPI